ncbi:redoxin domain-containing protein [Niastella caeni]|uniref:Redoxin domain-containing protein n=1 Tax=Niastella caeni TaxID=2569763 RepID=A0A4S8HDI3_9BACT|nr:redoxin domain-containing protein [Niastella caeni]THU32923.1 redoxin domain-containing protein [Niastella caeni]
MKTYIHIIIIICFLASCYGKEPRLNSGHEGKPIPSLNLMLTDSITNINAKDFSNGKPVVLIDISPYCPFCNAMMKDIIDENKRLTEIQFIFLSAFPIDDLKKISNKYQLTKYPNITIGRDYEGYFNKYYNSSGVPCIAIYGKNGLLKQVMMGKISTNLIKDIAFE